MDSVTALVLAALLGSWSVWLLFDRAGEPVVGGAPATRPPFTLLAVASVVLVHGALAWRRVRPLASFAIAAAATGVLLLTSIWWLLPSVPVYLLSLYTFSAYGRRHAPVWGLTASAVGAVVVAVCGFPLAGLPAGEWLVHVVLRLLPFVVAAWSLGMFRRVRVAYVAALEERAVRAEAEREERARRAVFDERARIAREMHDIVAHALSVVISQANGGRYAARAEPEAAVEALATIARTGRQALGDMRGLLRVLRTGDGEDDQFPQPALADLPALFDRVRAAGVRVVFEEHDAPQNGCLSASAELAAFRVVQEALTNTLKHAGDAAGAQVRFDWTSESVSITVRDDGAGGTASPGHGLIGMRERLAVVGGTLDAGPAPDGGFLVVARLPRVEVDR
ncbi:sensor histidine kinase [Saccharopolyspora taberi]|uniref:histidine kinase n=1 Tax=Saccharopolyspora taberi TaxID=60895 RepID=A0ABN3VBN7_9PSEU